MQPQDFIINFLTQQTYLAPIVLLFLEEAGFPLPTADFVIAYTGYHVSLGNISYTNAFFILLFADLLGSSLLYFLCHSYGAKAINKLSQYIDLDQHKLDLVAQKFGKYGPLAIIFGRHVPGFRIPITIFSGLSKIDRKSVV